YLAVVIDLWSRAVIGWSMSPRMTAQLQKKNVSGSGWRRTRPRNVIVHTDRGGQYCSADYFISREIMRATVFNYIECDYNRWRRHSWCGGLSPEQFENKNLA
ncbi:IS3 family transposase, partial [Shigella flexneri]|uniref:IS3 family transposase n=1 Tax=Shigella flexneri TaxID=623 RepID=UPI0011BD033F